MHARDDFGNGGVKRKTSLHANTKKIEKFRKLPTNKALAFTNEVE